MKKLVTWVVIGVFLVNTILLDLGWAGEGCLLLRRTSPVEDAKTSALVEAAFGTHYAMATSPAAGMPEPLMYQFQPDFRSSPVEDETDIEILMQKALEEIEALGDTYLELVIAIPTLSKYTLQPLIRGPIDIIPPDTDVDYKSRNKALTQLIEILPQIKQWTKTIECISAFLDVNRIHKVDSSQILLTLIKELRSKTKMGKHYLDSIDLLEARIQKSAKKQRPGTEPPASQSSDCTSPLGMPSVGPVQDSFWRECEEYPAYRKALNHA